MSNIVGCLRFYSIVSVCLRTSSGQLKTLRKYRYQGNHTTETAVITVLVGKTLIYTIRRVFTHQAKIVTPTGL